MKIFKFILYTLACLGIFKDMIIGLNSLPLIQFLYGVNIPIIWLSAMIINGIVAAWVAGVCWVFLFESLIKPPKTS